VRRLLQILLRFSVPVIGEPGVTRIPRTYAWPFQADLNGLGFAVIAGVIPPRDVRYDYWLRWSSEGMHYRINEGGTIRVRTIRRAVIQP
jgi:hypothetical protein